MNAKFTSMCEVLLGGVLLALAVPIRAQDLKDFVIGLGDDSPAAKVLRDHLAETLAEVKPPLEGKAQGVETKGGGSILCGDLFKTGSCFALFETGKEADEEPCTVGLAELADGKWQLRGLWKMPVVWLKAGAKWDGSDGGDYFPEEPYHEPFVLRDYNGDGVPEVLVAGEVGKYFTSSFLLKYVPNTHGLELLGWTKKRPEIAGEYVRFYEDSGHQAIWQEWTFLQWKEGKLVERATWHSEAPYNNIDPGFNNVRVTGADGKLEKFRATMGNSEEGNAWSYLVEKNRKPFAKIRVNWMPEKSRDNEDLMKGAWLFEKLTGLAREDFPERHGPETAKLGRLEDFATVEVEAAAGNEEARERFSGKK